MITDTHIRLLILKFMTGELSDAEAAGLAAWVSASKENAEAYRLEVEALSAQTDVSKDIDRFWNRVQAGNRDKFAKKRPARRLYLLAVAAASCAALVIGIAAWRLSVSGAGPSPVVAEVSAAEGDTLSRAPEAEVTAGRTDSGRMCYATGRNEKRRVTLPDGTRIVLNESSSLTLSDSFNECAREVTLNGEAFFDVAKDSTRLFIIRCGRESYIVRGTSFNINAYSEDSYSVTTLHEGSLEARINSDIIKLEPGEELRVDEIQSSISKQKVSVQNSTNWINSDIMIFEDTPLRQVVNCLSRRYGVRIHVQGEICNIKYTGKNSGRNIGDVFRLLEVTSPVPISVTEYEGEYYISRNK